MIGKVFHRVINSHDFPLAKEQTILNLKYSRLKTLPCNKGMKDNP